MSDIWVRFTHGELAALLSPATAIFDKKWWREKRSVHDKLTAAAKQNGSPHKLLAGSFEDDRGTIQDLIDGPVDSITRISTKTGAVRGNHFHNHTTQWTYVLSGALLVANNAGERIVVAGDVAVDSPGEPHAWKALEDTDCLVFTQGPRSGTDYESDTVRLDTPLLA